MRPPRSDRVGPGAKAYFDYVNAAGGVNGRKIEYRFYDDAYNPAQTVQLTRKLVEQDRVFAVFNSVGTANNLAIRDYLNARKVPQLFAGDGSEAIGGTPKRYPWTMGFLQSYRGEGSGLRAGDRQAQPEGAQVAVLYENTELGKDMTRGLSRAIAGKGPRIVASESYEYTGADVVVADREAEGLGRRHADAVRDAEVLHPGGRSRRTSSAGSRSSTSRRSRSSRRSWRSRKLNAPELTKGALSIAFVKNPNDPLWAKDPALALYRRIMRTHLPGGKPSDVYHWYGMTVAWTMVDTLKRRRPEPHPRVAAAGARSPCARPRTRSCSPGSACGRRATRLLPARRRLPLPFRQRAMGEGSTLLPAR